MGIFSSRKEKDDEVLIVLDIGSASVSGALVVLHPKKTSEILYSTTIPIVIPEEISEKKFTKSMITFVEGVLKQLSMEGTRHLNFLQLRKKDIKKVVCVYASPWFAAQTKALKFSEKEPRVLTEKFVSSLLETEEETFKKSLDIRDSVTIIEQHVLHTKLNGYATAKPYGKEARDIEMSLFLSIVPTHILEAVEQKIYTHFYPREIVNHSFSLVAYRTITNLFPADSNSCIFDVTGEVTDISIVEEDIITHTASIPFGRNTLVRKIAKEKNISTDIALSLLHLYSSNRAETKLFGEIDAVVAEYKNVWEKHLETLPIKNFSGKTVFVTADSDMASILNKYLATKSAVHVVILNEKHFEGVVHVRSGVEGNTFISTIAAFLNSLSQEK